MQKNNGLPIARRGARHRASLAAVVLLGCMTVMPLEADTIRAAVASNFSEAMKKLTAAFQETSEHRVEMTSGSSGKLYAQIRYGAPFDIFFSADALRPRRLEEEGLAVPGSRFIYALGRLALWSPREAYVDSGGRILEAGSFRFMAMPNPELAPYGTAARELLQAKGLWDSMNTRLVMGQNVGQAFQFVQTGNAELGFVAYAQLQQLGDREAGSFWLPPESMYSPIEQHAAVIRESVAVAAFVSFLKGPRALEIIAESGYGVPDAD